MLTSGGGAAPGANTAEFLAFVVTVPTRITHIAISVTAQAGNIDVGIYTDNAGPASRLTSLGSTACPATGVQILDVTDVTLQPGKYWAAFASNNAGTQISYYTLLFVYGNANPLRATKAASFPLPATIATPTIDNTGAVYGVFPLAL